MKARLAVLVLVAGMSTAALSATDFKELDTNADGYIDEQEAAELAALAEAFPQLDQDNDNKLSEEEFDQFEDPAEPPDKGG